MGDQNNGTFPVGFSWPPVDVPEGGAVTLFYQILNSGHKNHADLEKALSAYAEQQLPSTSPAIADMVGGVTQVSGVGVADCDGPITPPEGRKVVWNG